MSPEYVRNSREGTRNLRMSSRRLSSHESSHHNTLYRGTIIDIEGTASFNNADDHLRFINDGALLVSSEGKILYCGEYAYLSAEHEEIIDVRPRYIIPGFVDTHLHVAQTFSVHALSEGNLSAWLDERIFRDESELQSVQVAQRVVNTFNARRIAAGTTSALVVGSAYMHVQDMLYESSITSGLRVISGRGIQTVGPDSAQPLLFSEKSTVEMMREEILNWHSHDLTQVAITPRFALSVTADTLRGLSEIYQEYADEGVYFHTHLSESIQDEVPATLTAYGVESCLDVFDNAIGLGTKPYARSFLGPRSIFAHAVHMSDQELSRIADTSSSIAHCPISQQFLGSGIMQWKRTINSGTTVALGSDIAAGDQWCIAQVANAAYKSHALPYNQEALFLSPAQMLYLSTLAGAQALDASDIYGNFDHDKDADFLIIDPAASPQLQDSLEYCKQESDEYSIAQELFALLMGLDERAITGVFVRGKQCAVPNI